MQFDWDDENELHVARHGVSVEEVEEAFEDPRRINRPAGKGYERRYGFVGRTGAGRLLRVVYTRRGFAMRPISARDATSAERRSYVRQ